VGVTDPRIQARRVVVARQQGRHRRYRILAGLVIVGLVATGVALVHSSLFGARHVQIIGAPNIPTSTVIAAAGLRGDPPLIDLSAASIASRIERLPWVLTADVRIAWPSTVSIQITERIPVAAVAVAGSGGSYATCDVTGRVLEVGPRPASLPVVVPMAGLPGLPGTSLPATDRPLLEVAASLPESMVRETTEIANSPVGAVVVLSDHITAIIGGSNSLPQKFVSLATVLAHGALRAVSAIDLRVPAAPVLLPRGSGPSVPGNVSG
jgi:cell division protein FtsQ